MILSPGLCAAACTSQYLYCCANAHNVLCRIHLETHVPEHVNTFDADILGLHAMGDDCFVATADGDYAITLWRAPATLLMSDVALSMPLGDVIHIRTHKKGVFLYHIAARSLVPGQRYAGKIGDWKAPFYSVVSAYNGTKMVCKSRTAVVLKRLLREAAQLLNHS